MKRVPWWYMGLYLVLILAALPLMFRLVPPNRWYGFRLPGAMVSPEAWFKINALGGNLLVASWILCMGVNLLVMMLSTERARPFLGWINLVLIFLSFWFVSQLLLDQLP